MPGWNTVRTLVRPAALGLVLVAFLGYLAWIAPAGYYGVFHDDTVYFSSARALAQGQGYVIPSLPGVPPQTKYPILYSWLLSWVWKWDPSYPANVGVAVWITAAFACWVLVASYRLLLTLGGIGRTGALAIVGLVAFHQYFVFFSGALLSNVPFMALLVTAAVVADSALRAEGRWPAAVAAGVLTGLCVLMRTLGLAVVLGFAACAIYRRARRQLAFLLAAAAPLVVFPLVWSGRAANAVPPSATQGWWQTWLYYTSYTGYWKVSVPDLSTLAAMVHANVVEFLKSPASLCLFPPLGGEGNFLGELLAVTFTAGIWIGMARQARGQEWKPIHFVLPFYSGVLIPCNFSHMDSYLLAFLPLFYAGLWTETRHFTGMLARVLRERRPAVEKALAGALVVVVVAFGWFAAENYIWGLRPRLRGLVLQRTASAVEHRQLYDWILRHTSPQTRFVAYDDVGLYLATGRQAMWPLAFATGSFYSDDAKGIDRQMAHITDVPRQIAARYWVVTDADPAPVQSRLAPLKAALPLAMRTQNGKIELYDLACLLEPRRTECQTVVPALMPAEGRPAGPGGASIAAGPPAVLR